ncbi:hypothetical protein NDU88_003341 [Pleurodeles waltl]|uniref:Uncharacterized protein n=1 Tax=Pleurodeles waltl TaxID=8319 RepID=A0AAV7RGB1_PLEWA|nr:hypothetical protein NDU88_003341 [Pleurodeles waltl]
MLARHRKQNRARKGPRKMAAAPAHWCGGPIEDTWCWAIQAQGACEGEAPWVSRAMGATRVVLCQERLRETHVAFRGVAACGGLLVVQLYVAGAEVPPGSSVIGPGERDTGWFRAMRWIQRVP